MIAPLGQRHDRRTGITMLVVIVILSVSMLVIASAVTSLVDQQRQCRLRHTQRQCRLLANNGLDRAVQKLTADKTYTGESWAISANDISFEDDFEVVVEIKRETSGTLKLQSTVRYPAEGVPKVTESSELDISLTN